MIWMCRINRYTVNWVFNLFGKWILFVIKLKVRIMCSGEKWQGGVRE